MRSKSVAWTTEFSAFVRPVSRCFSFVALILLRAEYLDDIKASSFVTRYFTLVIACYLDILVITILSLLFSRESKNTRVSARHVS